MGIDSLIIAFEILALLAIPLVIFYCFRVGADVLDSIFLRLQGKKYKKEEYVLLRMVVPKEDPKEPPKGPLVAEQIFNALYGVFRRISAVDFLLGRAQDKFSFEIANINDEIYFYVYTLKKYQKMVEGQIYAHYPEVEITEFEDYTRGEVEVSPGNPDYPVFEGDTPSDGVRPLLQYQDLSRRKFHKVDALKYAVVGELQQYSSALWPIKTYEYFVSKEDKTMIDTLSGITSAMSKLNHKSDQAWYQVVIRPRHYYWQKYSREVFDLLREGYFQNPGDFMEWFYDWFTVPNGWYHWLVLYPITFVMKLVWRMLGMLKPIEKTFGMDERGEVGFAYWEVPKRKMAKIGFQVDIRAAYVPSDGNEEAARMKVREMMSSFNQFQWSYINGLGVARIESSSEIKRRFVERDFFERMLLNVEEIATVFHLPMYTLETPNIKWVRSKKLEPPSDLPRPGKDDDITILGKTNYRGDSREFGIRVMDRARHVYIIGKTGMGKSTLLENMVFSDIQEGRGVAVVDPHGELADKCLSFVPPHRIDDVVFFDPSDREFPVSFNMLEVKNPEHRSLVASGLVGVFKKIYAESWGPRLEHILRNTILALTEFEGATLLGIPRLLVDPIFREKVVEKVTDPVVLSFWRDEFAGMSDKFRTEAIAPIQNKVGQFLSSSIVRNILGQSKSSIDIRSAMDTKKILIVNLSKGKIGEDNSSLLGAMMITKFQLDAMSRADIEEKERVPFYLYVDEFQNFATDSFATILSEARKYKLNLTMANQYVAQMEEEVMEAVFGNVGTLITFQTGFDDAEYFSKQFAEEVMPNDIISLSKYTVYTRLLVDNMPTRTFSAVMSPPVPIEANKDVMEKVIMASRKRYSAKRDEVEHTISRWSGAALASPEEGKALKAISQGSSGMGVRWRYDRNKYEFEELVKSAGHKMRLLNREEYEKYGVKKAVNEYVYLLPEKSWIVYSRVDSQGNCFNKKEDGGILVEEVVKIKDKKEKSKDGEQSLIENKVVGVVGKAPGWQLGLNKILGGGFRSPQNRAEMEKVFERVGVKWEELARDQFEVFGLPKAVNELVMLLDGKVVVLTALDPQGGCFTKNPEQIIRVGRKGEKGFEEVASVKKSLVWQDELEKKVKELK